VTEENNVTSIDKAQLDHTPRQNSVKDKRAKRQLAAEAKHKVKSDAYVQKRMDEIHDKIALGTIQIVESMKKQPWCTRLEICWEVLFKRNNPNYNEVGEWIGPEEDLNRAPWCVRLTKGLKFWKKVKND